MLVDDYPDVGRAVRIALEAAGHRADIASSPAEAFSRLAAQRYDAILLDLNFTAGQTAGAEGFASLERIMADDPTACVLILTAHSGIRVAVAAMQAGARDFVMKPWRNSDLVAKIEAAMNRGARSLPSPPSRSGIDAAPVLLGESSAIGRVRDLVRRIGPTEAGVAVSGRSGAGRSLVARALHAASRSAALPLVTIDARDHERWAVLGQTQGTLVLRHPDRLDELTQHRLVEQLPLAVRLIAIIDSPAAFVAALRARIATVEIMVPPLTARGGDALILAHHFARVAAERHGLAKPRFTAAAERMVLDAVWPDEVRGLALAVERAVILATDSTIDAALILPPPVAALDLASPPSIFDLDDNEKAVIAAALREHSHNVTHAAAALGLSRGALYRRMERYGL